MEEGSTLHKKYLADLTAKVPGLLVRGFRPAINLVMELITGETEWFGARELRALPDAYAVRYDERLVEVYEAEVTPPLQSADASRVRRPPWCAGML
jgi:hypothetical protein